MVKILWNIAVKAPGDPGGYLCTLLKRKEISNFLKVFVDITCSGWYYIQALNESDTKNRRIC